jgi:alkylhydroperoxidase family enzyme
MLANGGGAALGYLRMGSQMRFAATLDPQVRELIILRTGSLCGSAYELDHHEQIAANLGMPADKIRAAVDVGAAAPVFDGFEQALLRFTEEAVRDGAASEGAFTALAAHYQPEQLIEVTLLIGFYMMTARFLRTFRAMLENPLEMLI